MQALYIVIPVVGIFMIAYRYYSAFIAAKVMSLDDARVTPAHSKYDGANFHPMSRWVLFGHHFAAIAGAGPLVGPVLAAQFGFAPGLLWLVAGCTLCGAVHDSMCLWTSTRRGGKSLANIARAEIGPGRRHRRRAGHPVHPDRRARRSRHRRRQRAGGKRVEHLHDRRHDSDRRSSWASTCSCSGREDSGGDDHRHHPDPRPPSSSAGRSPSRRYGHVPRAVAPPGHGRDGHLRASSHRCCRCGCC